MLKQTWRIPWALGRLRLHEERSCVPQRGAPRRLRGAPAVRPSRLVWSHRGSVRRGPPGSWSRSDKRPCGARSGSCTSYCCCHTLTSCGAYSSRQRGAGTSHLSQFSVVTNALSHTDNTHLYAQTAGLPFLCDGALSAGPTEHIGAHFAFALLLLKEKKHIVWAWDITLVSTGVTHWEALLPCYGNIPYCKALRRRWSFKTQTRHTFPI